MQLQLERPTVIRAGIAGVALAAAVGAVALKPPAPTTLQGENVARDVPIGQLATKNTQSRAKRAKELAAAKRRAASQRLSRTHRTAPAAAPRIAQRPATAAVTPAGQAQEIAHRAVLAKGWSEADFAALVQLWNRESEWRTTAQAGSGAYGIPQALPASKMASHGDDWQTNPATQIAWGLDYIAERYGTPSAAWAFWQANNWY